MTEDDDKKRRKIKKTATNFADASGSGADAARGVLEILVAKERSPRSIGNIAKLDCIFFPQKTDCSRQDINKSANYF